ncbi:hypothetical protein OROGR_027684 [Orobanche gracilis]
MKGDKIARRSSFGNMVRRRLSDITNYQPQPKSASFPENKPPDSTPTKGCIDHLVKEKMALVKLIQEKNKIIELSGMEIQNLRTCLQKMQLQNWHFAQSNSHMLAELNMGRERLKALHHEVACKEALLKTKNSLRKGKEKVNGQQTEFQEREAITEEPGNNEDTKCCSAGRRPRGSRSRSLGNSKINQQPSEKEAVVSKRRCLRRQSSGSKLGDDEGTDNMFEINKMPSSSRQIHEAGSTVSTPSAKEILTNGSRYYASELEAEARRTSTGRPLRKAVGKVQSYKEKSLSVKMRRSE